MEKVKTFLADISDLLDEKNYQKIYEKVPVFRQEKADRLKHREDQAQSVGAWISLDEDTGETPDTEGGRAVL